ncbi:MAG: hypothetical protein J6M64_04165 [Oscillospiraceae bacterium]|nr:hypothetical protein [Oscillospiraceae bacterium]
MKKFFIEEAKCELTKGGIACGPVDPNVVTTSPQSGMVFRPLFPHLEMKMYLIWNKYQSFTPIAERFLNQVKDSFSNQ